MSFKVDDKAYIKLYLHAIKYHKNDCFGKFSLLD